MLSKTSLQNAVKPAPPGRPRSCCPFTGWDKRCVGNRVCVQPARLADHSVPIRADPQARASARENSSDLPLFSANYIDWTEWVGWTGTESLRSFRVQAHARAQVSMDVFRETSDAAVTKRPPIQLSDQPRNKSVIKTDPRAISWSLRMTQ